MWPYQHQNKKKTQKAQKPKGITITYNDLFTKKEKRIHDTYDKRNIGVLFWNQSTLEELTKLSGPLATANEYQIHYWSLVARQKFSDGSILDIAFPTTIFNYAQEVSGAHIDFELKDVKEVSDAIKPVHNMVTNKLLPQLQELFKNANVEFIEVPMNTMHRHPTGVASFSGTDLKQDHEENTGIVFPLQSANEDPSFSSIIYNNPVKMVHSEYRIATGNTEDIKGINYREGRCITYVKGSTTIPSGAEQAIGIKAVDTSYVVTKDNELKELDLQELLSSITYEPNTQFVKAENLKKKTYTTYSYYNNKSAKKDEKPKKTADLFKKTSDEPTLKFTVEERSYIKQATELTFKDFVQMQTMAVHILKLHCLELERYYYSDESLTMKEYDKYTKTDLIDHALELQDHIIDELVGSPTYIHDQEEIEDDIENIPTVTNEDYMEFMGILYEDESEYYYTYGHENNKTFEQKIKELAETGMKKEVLNTASVDNINRWHSDLTK